MTNDVFKIMKFSYPYPRKILLIGCGGTGGYVLGPLARTLKLLNKNIDLIIADGDVVEEKNLLRQNFISADIGRNKAEVLAERYSAAFGGEIAFLPNDITTLLQIQGLISEGLVIGCVDNNASRILIGEWFSSYSGADKYWIDSGNEKLNGQVVMGARAYYRYKQPCALQVYENLKIKDSFNHERSCAERAISSPQNIQANITASNIVLNYVNLLLFEKDVSSFAVEFGINNTYKTKFNSIEEFNRIGFRIQ
jgi:PRTRC genetic system ThiF family protein